MSPQHNGLRQCVYIQSPTVRITIYTKCMYSVTDSDSGYNYLYVYSFTVSDSAYHYLYVYFITVSNSAYNYLYVYSISVSDSAYCPPTWDSLACWPETKAGETAVISCPNYLNQFDSSGTYSFIIISFAYSCFLQSRTAY